MNVDVVLQIYLTPDSWSEDSQPMQIGVILLVGVVLPILNTILMVRIHSTGEGSGGRSGIEVPVGRGCVETAQGHRRRPPRLRANILRYHRWCVLFYFNTVQYCQLVFRPGTYISRKKCLYYGVRALLLIVSML